jgi:hypothetical protein
MSVSAEEGSVPASDCEQHSVIELQRIVLKQRQKLDKNYDKLYRSVQKATGYVSSQTLSFLESTSLHVPLTPNNPPSFGWSFPYHSLISNVAKFTASPGGSPTSSPSPVTPAPTHSNPASLPSNPSSDTHPQGLNHEISTPQYVRHHSSKRSEATVSTGKAIDRFLSGLIWHTWPPCQVLLDFPKRSQF